jgi:UTP--glucose-1-phosphate uridylyltransferase
MPKEMLPLVDTPLIQYVVDEAYRSDIRQMVVVTGRGKTAIEDHFDTNFEIEHHLRNQGKDKLADTIHSIGDGWSMAYVRQHEALGLGHAVLQAEPVIGSEAFAVLLADDVIIGDPSCLAQLLTIHEQTGESVVALMEVPEAQVSSYGIASGEVVSDLHGGRPVMRIRQVVEKPLKGTVSSRIAVIGRYILQESIFSHIKRTTRGRNGEIQLTDAIQSLTDERPVYGVLFSGRRYDAGDKLGFLKASLDIALNRSDIGPELALYLRTLAASHAPTGPM